MCLTEKEKELMLDCKWQVRDMENLSRKNSLALFELANRLIKKLNIEKNAQDKVCIACDIRQAVTGWHNSFCVECWEIME